MPTRGEKRARLAATFLLVAASYGCAAATRAEPARDASPRAGCPAEPGLCFSLTPADAEVVLEDVNDPGRTTPARARGFVRLDPGIYRVTIRRTHFVTWRAEVAVQNIGLPIEVDLEPEGVERAK